MKTIIKLEELAIFLLSVYFYSRLNLEWWWFPLLLPAPDVSMLGYLINNKAGAFFYNLVHHRAAGIALYIGGLFFETQGAALAGIILLAHTALDRIFQYGLKYAKGFKYTSLGEIQ